jgi:spermidine synthase
MAEASHGVVAQTGAEAAPAASVQADGQIKTLHLSTPVIQSSMWVLKPDALDLEYTRLMMGFLLFHPAPARIAMIGLGGGSLAKFCYRHLPKSVIEVAEISPDVIALRNEFHIPPDNARLTIREIDGADFVRDATRRPDVLLVDGFDADGVPPQLSSQAFYEECRAMLAPDGILVVNLHQQDPELPVLLRRIRRAFDDAVFDVVDEDGANCIVFGRNGPPFRAPDSVVPRRPGQLDRDGWRQLMPAFAQIAAAMMAL